MGLSKFDDAVPDDANGGLVGNGAMSMHQSSAVSGAHTAADDSVTHRLHLLSRRIDKQKWMV